MSYKLIKNEKVESKRLDFEIESLLKFHKIQMFIGGVIFLLGLFGVLSL